MGIYKPMEFQNSLQDKLGEHEPTEVDELILDDLYTNINEFTPEHKKTLEMYDNLLHLSLNNFGLRSLKNFPSIKELRVLEIRQNNLNGSDLAQLMSLYPNLYKLKVGENPITSIDVFKPFTSYQTLKKLELIDCDVTKRETYRDDLFKLLKNVQTIDRMTREGDEVDTTFYDEGEEGEFEDGEFMDEDDEDFEDDEFEDDEDFEESEEEDMPNNKNGKKARRE